MFLPKLRRSSCVHGRGIDQLSEPGYGNIPGDRMPETQHVQERTQISRQNEIGAFLATSFPWNEDTETPTFGTHTDLLGELRTDECVVLMAIELGCWMPACSRQLPSDGNTFNLDRCSEPPPVPVRCDRSHRVGGKKTYRRWTQSSESSPVNLGRETVTKFHSDVCRERHIC